MDKARNSWPLRYRLRAVLGAQVAAEAVAVVAELRLQVLRRRVPLLQRQPPAVAANAARAGNSRIGVRPEENLKLESPALEIRD